MNLGLPSGRLQNGRFFCRALRAPGSSFYIEVTVSTAGMKMRMSNFMHSTKNNTAQAHTQTKTRTADSGRRTADGGGRRTLQWGSSRSAMRSAMGYRDGSLFARSDSCNGPAMGLQWGPPTSSPNRKGTLHNPIAGPIAGPLQAHCRPIARPLQELLWI